MGAAILRGGGAGLRLLSDGGHGYTSPIRSRLTRHQSGGLEADGLEDAMYAATLEHSTTSLAPSAGRARRLPRSRLTGAVVLALAWSLLAGSFLLDVARPPRGAGARAALACAPSTPGP
jgi:hypothetical protein